MDQPIEKTARTEYTQALRDLADWLDSTPSVPAPTADRLLLPLHTVQAVQEFAAEHGLTVAYDGEGNASADLHFGPVLFHAYGYVDFAEHIERANEQRARAWASCRGLAIQPAEDGAAASRAVAS